jgi:arylsulfatase A-like enzyme
MRTSRRDFLKVLGGGAVSATLVTGCDTLSPASQSAPAAAATPTKPAPTPSRPVPTATPVPATAAPLVTVAPQSGPTPPGEDPLSAVTMQSAPNMEPVIAHNDQATEAKNKLAALEKKTGKRPNVLVFLMDNFGYGDVGIYGGGLMTGAPTPNMDRLGREGLQLFATYSQPSCTPTRCTMLTGRLPLRHGQLRPSFAGEPGGLGTEITVAQILSKAGYVTQAIGKWHCGENKESQPQNVGFDDFYGFLGWSGLYTDWQDAEFAPDFALSPERQALVKRVPFNDHIVHATKGKDVENQEEITIEMSAQLDDKFAAYGVKFLQSQAKSDKPFFMYYCTRGGHFKNYANPKFRGKSPARYPYKDCVMEMDDVLGRLVKALQDTGQLENTLIFITSDNGPTVEPWPDAGWTPFRGGIGSTWEGGVRVPGIVYWKGMITPGRQSTGLFDLSDLFNTSIALAKAQDQLPKDRYIDGIDQTSFLLSDAGLSNRKYVYFWLMDVLSGLRVAEYKFMIAGMSRDDADVVNPGGVTTLENYKNGKLFNLFLDPGERFSMWGRQTFMDNLFSDPIYAHRATFVTYPPKVPIAG